MEATLYDTDTVMEFVAKNKKRVQGFVSVLTVIEYPPALNYASKVLYPEKRDYSPAQGWLPVVSRLMV